MPDTTTTAQRLLVAKRALRSIPNAKLDPAAIDVKGSVLNILANMSAAMAEDVERRALAKHAARTLDGAFGEELYAYVTEITFGLITVLGASPSSIPLSLSRNTGAMPAGTLAGGTAITIGSTPYTLDAPVSFLLSQTGPILATATSTQQGSATVTLLTSPAKFSDLSVIFDSNIQIIPTANSAGGSDTETDAQLKARARTFPSLISRGTLAAIQGGAFTVPGIRQAAATELLDSSGNPTGQVACYVSDLTGQANSALIAKVRIALRSWRCAGINVTVFGGTPSYQTVTLKIGYQNGFDSTAVQANAVTAVVNAVATLNPNDVLYRSTILQALKAVPGIIVADGAIVVPAGDIFPVVAGTTFRVLPGSVTFL